MYIYLYVCVYRYISLLYIYYVVYLYITLGTNNAYKNINLGRQTFNYKSVSLEILTNATITVARFYLQYRNHRETAVRVSLIQHKSLRVLVRLPLRSTAALKSQTNHYLSSISKPPSPSMLYSLYSPHFFFFLSTPSWSKLTVARKSSNNKLLIIIVHYLQTLLTNSRILALLSR